MDPLIDAVLDAYSHQETSAAPTREDWERLVDRLFPLVVGAPGPRWVDYGALHAAMHRGTCSVAFASIEARSTVEDRACLLGRMVGKAPPLFLIPRVYDLPLCPTLAGLTHSDSRSNRRLPCPPSF